jgi:hypothetical protein
MFILVRGTIIAFHRWLPILSGVGQSHTGWALTELHLCEQQSALAAQLAPTSPQAVALAAAAAAAAAAATATALALDCPAAAARPAAARPVRWLCAAVARARARSASAPLRVSLPLAS